MADTDGIFEHTFHHAEFKDKAKLVERKERQGARISLAFPTLNEEATIGKEILVIKTELMDRFPLLDEIAVIDSGSTDGTRRVAEGLGAKFFQSKDILPGYGSFRGKGENLWKSLFVLSGDIIVWIDADIRNIGPRFVYGLIGPLLKNPRIAYVKAFYERPFHTPDGLTSSGGGRVTEILIRPLFSLFYPELACLIQPLSGEYAGRRGLLEELPFSVGYGVEIGHLIDIYHRFGTETLAQVNMDSRVHRNQSVQALGKMAFGILNTFLNRLNSYNESKLLKDVAKSYISVAVKETRHETVTAEIPLTERPPMVDVQEYRQKFRREAGPASTDASVQ
jgi:glucosyl-3-phosphoglycerate synthase